MKLVVKEEFIDKYNGNVYRVGEPLDFDDAERIEDLEKRNLVIVVREEPVKKAPKRARKAKS